MIVQEQVLLSTVTTLKVGGPARYLIDCSSLQAIEEAVSFARAHNLPYRPLGQGSNLLAQDVGYDGVLLRISIDGIHSRDKRKGEFLYEVGAGVSWDTFVDVVTGAGLWGVENLAGIPGTVGAAPVQNIGAYGSEVGESIQEVEVYNTENGTVERISNSEAGFGYRTSIFKKNRNLIITKVTFLLRDSGLAKVDYPDLSRARLEGVILDTPAQIATAVRAIRAKKFPDLKREGTAGSFFKNPIVTAEEYERLHARFPGMPGFRNDEAVKIPLAWILDRVLSLKGFAVGGARLFERQPLVIVTTASATAVDVNKLADEVSERVRTQTGITIEREVQSL